MYEKFTENCYNREDYLEKTFSVMKDFKEELDGIDYAAELAKLMK